MDKIEQLKQQVITYCAVFGSEQGAKVLDDLRIRCMGDRTSFVPDDAYGRMSAYNEGRRSVYLYIRHLMELNKPGVIDSFAVNEEREASHV